MDEQTARRDICRIGQLLYERSYVVSSDGNVSVRLDDGRIVATPTMICKGRMTEDSLAITDASGKALTQRKPSSELAMLILSTLVRMSSTRYVLTSTYSARSSGSGDPQAACARRRLTYGSTSRTVSAKSRA